MLPIIVLNRAVRIRSLTGLYPSRAFSAIGLSINATPDLCMSSLPLLRIRFPLNRLSSTPNQCVSAMPIMSHLNLLSSFINMVVAPGAFRVLTFQHPTVMIDLGVRIDPLTSDLSAAPLPLGFRRVVSSISYRGSSATWVVVAGTLTQVFVCCTSMLRFYFKISKFHSTETTLLSLHDDLIQAMDKQQVTA